MKTVLKWPTLKSVIELRYFHGLATFYRKFIRSFNIICGPLTKKMRGDKKELMYLGFVVLGEGLKMDLEKVKAILEWPTPRSTKKVRSFHGLATFYRKFIRCFSSICGALNEIMR